MPDKLPPPPFGLKVTDLSDETIPNANRAGIVPFVVNSDGSMIYLMIKPQLTPGHPDGPPNFQIIRSERETAEDKLGLGSYPESPLETALRSGRQEAGVHASNIKRLYDLGTYTTKAREGGYHNTQLYAVQLANTTDFSNPEKPFGKGWKSPLKDAAEMRDSHSGILMHIDSKLKTYLASGRDEVDVQVQMPARSAGSNLERVMPVVDMTRGLQFKEVTKVGILPFVTNEKGGHDFLLMMPRATMGHPGGAPSFQIAKGTRVTSFGSKSWDMGRQEERTPFPPRVETYLETAIREGREELGLKASNIKRMFDLGVYSVNSETSGQSKEMRLFAAELKSPNTFFSRPQPTTQQVQWFRKNEGNSHVKKSHMRIVEDAGAKLGQWLAREKGAKGRSQ